MKIDAAREGGSAVLRLGGRLDREGAEQLSNTLEDLLRDGVRSVTIDLATVTYISSPATKVVTRWQQELIGLRGEVHLRSVPPALDEALAIAGWDSGLEADVDLAEARMSHWQSQPGWASRGQYQVASGVPDAALTCRLHGHPDQLTRGPLGPDLCAVVAFPTGTFGLGLGAIGSRHEECRERLGELVAVAGCVAYFPSDGARMPDYLIADGQVAPGP
jgi:anti-anti-sigma factor